MCKSKMVVSTCILLTMSVIPAIAGDLDSPAPPDTPESAMFTLEQIYNRLDSGDEGAKRGSIFVEPFAGPAATGQTLDEVMAICPIADNLSGASPEDVLSGRNYWSLRTDGTWGFQTGNGNLATGTATADQVLFGVSYSTFSGENTGMMPDRGQQTILPGASTVPILPGFHDGTGSVVGDTDLLAENIRSGVSLFGVVGSANVVDTTSGDATAADIAFGKKAWVDGAEITGSARPAPIEKSGQATCWDASGVEIPCAGTGQDGDLQRGVPSPSPRFTDNGNGTITDNLTGLIWLKNASCFGLRLWTQALADANTLADGACGLTDNSAANDWRLPNIKELLSLIHYGFVAPALSNSVGSGIWSEDDAFSSVKFTSCYYSSTPITGSPRNIFRVCFSIGTVVGADPFTDIWHVWPVRGGQ